MPDVRRRFLYEPSDLILQLASQPAANYDPSQPRDEDGKWTDGGGGGSLTSVKERVWSGEPVPVKTKLNWRQTGAIGEQVAVDYLTSLGGEAEFLNLEQPNYPVDVIHGQDVYEVKTGLVSNGDSAQHWRTTIGEPSDEEKIWLQTLTRTKKAEWNQKKQKDILDRKHTALVEISDRLGLPVESKTMTAILNPDTRTVDLYKFDGFHQRIGWKSDEAQSSYIGTYQY